MAAPALVGAAESSPTFAQSSPSARAGSKGSPVLAPSHPLPHAASPDPRPHRPSLCWTIGRDKADPDGLFPPLPSLLPPIFHLSFARLPPAARATGAVGAGWRPGCTGAGRQGPRSSERQERCRGDVCRGARLSQRIQHHACRAEERSRETYRKCREKLRSFPICQGAVGTKGNCFRSSCS